LTTKLKLTHSGTCGPFQAVCHQPQPYLLLMIMFKCSMCE